MVYSARILFLILLILPHFLFSGNDDTIKVLKKNTTTRFFNESQFENGDSLNYIGYSLDNFQNYTDRNTIGNIGQPINDLSYRPLFSQSGFNYSKNNFDNYFFSPNKFKYYNTRVPFTDLSYVIASKKEQIFKMTFSYNVKKNWNVTADFYRIRSDGFYLRQNTNDNFLALSSNFKSLNNRYYFLTNIIYNSIKNAENGGISDDSTFTISGVDKLLVGVYLKGAKRTVINRSVYFKQFFNFGRVSADTAAHGAIIPESRIILTSMYEDNVLKYEDDNPSSKYYSNIYFDSTKTTDSTHSYKIENEIAWKRLDNKRHRGLIDIIGAGLNIKHEFIKIQQRELFTLPASDILHGLVSTDRKDRVDTTSNNIIAGGELYNTYSDNKFWWNLSAKYTISGYNKGDHYAGAFFKKAIKDSSNVLIIKAETRLHAPDFMYNRYTSNNFIWNNTFEKMQESHLKINFSMSKYHLSAGADFASYSNILYFNTSALPSQYKGPIAITSLYLKKDFIFHSWHWNNKINYQIVPDSSVIRLPEFILEHSLYYETDLFKRAMRMAVGASVFYTSAYYANAYMPATAQFYLQDQKKYGNYPFIDFFINVQIKTVRIFFKIDHLNYGLSGTNYMLTPYYPMNDRALKFGVSWRFFD